MPGLRENVVKLNADHSGVCKFGDSLEDQDNFKLVQCNIKDLYKKALKTGELSAISCDVSREQRAKYVQGQQLKRHQESDNTSRKRARITDRTDSDIESYDDDDGDSANGKGLDREAYGGDYGDSSEVVNADEEDRGDEEEDSEEDSGEEDSSEEDSIDEDSESDYE
jgi:hypothetical protein